jgi:hypothetical protein
MVAPVNARNSNGVSMYDNPDPHAVDSRVGSTSNGNQNTSGSGTTSGSQSGATASTQNTANTSTTVSQQLQQIHQVTKNMSPQAAAALNLLISQLAGGGTAETRARAADRNQEINTVRGERSAYSKQAAFSDAQGLIQQQQRRALESMLPSISRAAEDAGSSGGALRALLMQDSANKAAESASALGMNAAVNYGNISSNLSQVLEKLTQGDPNGATALLVNALNVAKGAESTTDGTTKTSGTSTTTGSATQNNAAVSQQNTTGATTQQNSQNTTENKAINTDYAPFQVTNQQPILAGGNGVEPGFVPTAGTSAHNMNQLSGFAQAPAWYERVTF